jgi:Protein of unknown function (DUF2442)
MNTLIDTPAVATYANGEIFVRMESGIEFCFACSAYPRLAAASDEQRANLELSPLGFHWPDLDEDLSIRGLLRDHASK